MKNSRIYQPEASNTDDVSWMCEKLNASDVAESSPYRPEMAASDPIALRNSFEPIENSAKKLKGSQLIDIEADGGDDTYQNSDMYYILLTRNDFK